MVVDGWTDRVRTPGIWDLRWIPRVLAAKMLLAVAVYSLSGK